MPVLKRPASSQPHGSLKRPASAIKDVVTELNEGVKASKSEQNEDGDQELRDKQKSQKFHKMLQAGTLPDHIVHMYNQESKKSKDGARAYQTKLINALFSKNSDGTYRLQTEKHQFEEYRKVYHQSLAKDKTEALPRTLMLASHFHGHEGLMKKAIDNGELVSKVDSQSKIEYLQFRKFANIELRGTEEGERVHGLKKITREQAHAMADVMSKLKWKFQLTKASN